MKMDLCFYTVDSYTSVLVIHILVHEFECRIIHIF